MSYYNLLTCDDGYEPQESQSSHSLNPTLFNEESLAGNPSSQKVSLLSSNANTVPQVSQTGRDRRRQEWRDNSDRDEVLEDVSTWSLDTIRQVASSLHQQGVWQADDTPAMASWEEEGASALTPMRSWHSDEPSTSTTHAVISTPTAEFTAQSTINHQQTKRKKKNNMYEWEPQQDPKMEKKRLRALKQFQFRQQEDQEEQNLRHCLDTTTQEVAKLKHEAARRRRQVKELEQNLATALSLSSQQGQYTLLKISSSR
ncbi:hypothetical protein Pcinc_024697 [Petrolisthes cinctipes]|uniref:Uncharacterized protein n=1 Tax=Petrolisthes cinctipes TaxID=88211 RepID=A0AAE1FAD1_PETCI|nr:hypothetical protein Pcinc_024697 [Petrolisthes cinctipes]